MKAPAEASKESPILHGFNAPSAIAAIKARAASRKLGQPDSDNRKLALIIEGGGMRGVASGGGALALAHLGFTDLFDEVYATSAGVMNASYFLSGQGDLGITIYYDNLSNRKFINPLRFWKVLDVDYVFNRVITIEKPLAVEKILSSRSRFFVVAMDAANGEGLVIDTQKTPTPLLTVLKAATAIPVLYNRTVEVEGRPCIDGGLLNPFPLEQALASGCTDILVLLTRSAAYQSKAPSAADRFLFKLLCVRRSPEVRKIFARHHDRANQMRDLAFGRAPLPPGVSIATICVDDFDPIDRMTRDPKILHDAALRFGRKTLRVFNADADAWTLPAPAKLAGTKARAG